MQERGQNSKMNGSSSHPVESRRSGERSYRRASTTSNSYSNMPLYRHNSNLSHVSFVSEVEMAHDEVFAGPMSESVPSSITSFVNRRSHADSVTSFTYFQEEDESPEYLSDQAIIDESDDETDSSKQVNDDLASSIALPRRKQSSAMSRMSAEDPLLQGHDSTETQATVRGHAARTNQKISIETEGLLIVIAGFKTRISGYTAYITLCTLTLGLCYLLLRWLPRWRVWMIGCPKPLQECAWVVVENQWGEFTVQDIDRLSYGHSLSTVFGTLEKTSFDDNDEDDDPVVAVLRFLDYRYIRFCFHPLKDRFVPCSNWKDPAWTDVRKMRTGLDSEERSRREQVFGKNDIEIRQKSSLQLLVDEVFHPFYVFQVASLTLWSLDEYYYYAICIFLISAVSIITTLIETRNTMKRLREISRFQCEIRVLRNGFWRQVLSSELVPGDVFEVSDPSLSQIPCDSLLLAGDCVMNESMLTGESVPVSKVPAINDTLHLLNLRANSISAEVAKHFLYSGTKLIRARRPQETSNDEAAALAIVVRTGFNTTKGALIRSMLFPKPSGFKFYKDAFRYISVMAGVAGIGFIASFINFFRLGLAWHLIIVRALDLITIVVPPALPATLTIGTNFALSRLKKKNIYCISPQRVNVGGKLDIVCFDKTGTLTEEGLDVLGLRVVNRPAMRFSDIQLEPTELLPSAAFERDPTVDYELRKAALYTMATCHSLRVVNGEAIGDPLDIKMFEFTGWLFEENERKTSEVDYDEQNDMPASIARPPAGSEYDINDPTEPSSYSPIELRVLKNFEFVTQLRRASVIVREAQDSGGNVYVKGAPECMVDICNPASFPTDYEDLLAFYTHRGFRVIACATKRFQELTPNMVKKVKRSDAEKDLEFIGFIIFENKLKPSSEGVIKELHEANIRQIMCTGDNILTAICVARESSLIDRTAHCFVPHFVEGGVQDLKARLKWQSVDNPLFELDDETLAPLPPPVEGDASLPYEMSNVRNYTLAVSGDAFRWIIEYGSDEMLQRMLVCGQVFARMSPDEKHELIERLQSIDYCCGFCGDGANDCGALKAADVGISLSEAEASVAAPFTSRIFNTSCVPQIVREGRAALVTSFCCFKYMSLYSAIQFTSVSFLYASASNLGDFQFLYIDLCLILPIAIFMGWTGPYPILSRKRPTASLVSRKILIPLLGHVAFCILVQLIGFKSVQRQTWFIPPELDKEHSNISNSENTTLFLLSCYQYILSALILSSGPPFRQSMTKNLPLVVTIVTTVLFSSYMLFDPAEALASFMQLTRMSAEFETFVLALALGGFACGWIGERRVFPWLARAVGRRHIIRWTGRRQQRKRYKTLLEGMRI